MPLPGGGGSPREGTARETPGRFAVRAFRQPRPGNSHGPDAWRPGPDKDLILRADGKRHSPATVDDFIALTEKLSGRELRDVFGVWLYGKGKPPRT
ncbi:hypothetical protein GCM10020367_33260 [Streptomyces sannanensis]|uniref:Uncharacterized protein n=1 Tax=Streptomyces sannanensis TaxID=285536 RepID=A0ABP6SCS6_9ACTN